MRQSPGMARMTDQADIVMSPLVADIFAAQVKFTADINDRVIDSLQYQVKQLEAWRSIVESRIYRLCSQPWVPNPQSITSALIVSQEAIDEWIAASKEDDV